jgi:hypothetical protein
VRPGVERMLAEGECAQVAGGDEGALNFPEEIEVGCIRIAPTGSLNLHERTMEKPRW